MLLPGLGHAFFYSPTFGMWPYIPQYGIKKGAVYTRAVVPGPNGYPVYVEFDSSGDEVLEIGELTGDLANVRLMSGSLYRAYRQQYREKTSAHPEALTLDRDAYLTQTF